MVPARFQVIEEIFHSARELDPATRQTFVTQRCGGDEELRKEVEALLASHDSADDFIHSPPARLTAELLAEPPIESMIGRSIGHYELLEKIGSGGMGEVYLARDDRSGRKAAVKILPAHFAGDEIRFRRFEQEARAVVALNHPNILTVYEVGNEEGMQYIASELIEGKTLRQRLERGPMPLEEIVDLALQVASALAAAHKAGIVHRDIKPENIMLRPDGYVKVLDFGVAKLAEQELPPSMPKDEALLLVRTTFSSMLGTLRYMSPEQARGEPVDARTDIWSLGVVLYEMLTGSTPFSGAQAREVIASVLTIEPPSVQQLRPETSAQLQRIIARAMQKDRTARYPAISEMMEDLREVRRKLDFARELAATGERQIFSLGRRHAFLIYGALIVLLASIGLIFLDRFLAPKTKDASLGPQSAKSVAVLPFENLSGDKQNDYFVSGMQDEILTKLAGVDELRVISRLSTMKYQSHPEDIKKIASELGVDTILEGSVQKAGERALINAQLIDARTDTHLWARSYDRDLKNIFTVESEVAEQVANALKLKLLPSAAAELETPPTKDPVAYDLYLRGTYAHKEWFRGTGKVEEAFKYLQEAIARDPNFAQAEATLAICEAQKVGEAPGMDPALADAARAHAEKAFSLQPDLSVANVAIGLVYLYIDRNYSKAIEHLERVPGRGSIPLAVAQGRTGHWSEAVETMRSLVKLNPRDAHSFQVLAIYYGRTGQYAESLAALDRAVSLDPDNLACFTQRAEDFLVQGQLGFARNVLGKMPEEVKANMNTFDLSYVRWQLEFLSRNYSAAFQMAEKMSSKPTDSTSVGEKELLLARTELVLGKKAEALRSLDDARMKMETLVAAHPDATTPHQRLALIHAARGDKQRALAEAEKLVALSPMNQDVERGMIGLETLAEVHSSFGDADQAIPLLEGLLHTDGAGLLLTPELLKLDPIWDPIRNDPRFQKLLASAAPK